MAGGAAEPMQLDDCVIIDEEEAPEPAVDGKGPASSIVCGDSELIVDDEILVEAAPAVVAATARKRSKFVCSSCQQEKPRRSILKLPCGHHYDYACFRSMVEADRLRCTSCKVPIPWSDLFRGAGCELYSTFAQSRANQLQSFLGRKTIPCCPKELRREMGADRCNLTLQHTQGTGKRERLLLVLTCAGKPRSCGRTVCGACGARYDPGPPDPASSATNASKGPALHDCADMIAARLADLLRQLALQRVSAEKSQSKKKARASQHAGGGFTGTKWSKGVGFGGARGSAALDVRKLSSHRAKEVAADLETTTLIARITEVLKECDADVFSSCAQKSGRLSGARLACAIHAILHSSCLAAVVFWVLRNDSLLDITTHRSGLFLAVLALLEELVRHELTLDVIHHASLYREQHARTAASDDVYVTGQKRKAGTAAAAAVEVDEEEDTVAYPSAAELLRGLQKQAKVFRRQNLAAGPASAADKETELICSRISAVHDTVQAAFRRFPSHLKSEETIDLSGAAVDAVEDEMEALTRRYKENMANLTFRMVTMDLSAHYHRDAIRAAARQSLAKDRMRRIRKEISSLPSSLPFHFQSVIAVRVDETRPDVIKALIIGPEGTPYANGCFTFDIFLPATYPNSPPLVQFTTTGRGTVRFNPNLYDMGKVCLSLLGTWQGPGWVPQESTLLQVLLSIQSLILVEQPYYNEPGYETHGSDASSKRYNLALRFQTMRIAMLGHFSTPVPEFNALIHQHFVTKKDHIRTQIEEWVADMEAAPRPFMGHESLHELAFPTLPAFVKVAEQMTKLLDSFKEAESVTLD